MIFVTVGTTHFDELVGEVDRLVAMGRITERVYAQIGSGKYIPEHIEWVRYLDNIREVEESADLVICHGGVGSVFELMELKKPFIAVPNRQVQDDHQSDLLRALESEGSCTCCWDLSQLGAVIADRRHCLPDRADGELAKELWKNLLSDPPAKRGVEGKDSTMASARVYARNLGINWLSFIVSLVVMFFLSPFVVHTLGQVEYGIWSLVTVLTGYMGILDLGVRASTGRHIFLYLGRDDHEKVDATIRTGLGFYSLVGLLILAVGVVLGWYFPAFFPSVPKDYHNVIRFLLPLMALNVWIGAFASVFSSVLAAHERFDLARGVDLFVLAIRTLGTVLVLSWGYGVIGLAVVAIGCKTVAMLANRHMAGRVYPQLKAWPWMFSRERVRELLGYGIAAFIISISVRVIGQTDLVIVGMAIGIQEVAVYSVGAMLLYYSDTLLQQIGTTFFPSVQRAAARDELGPVRWLFRRQVRLALIVGLPMYIGFILFSHSFIRLWMLGPEFPETAVQSAALVMAILAASKLAYLMIIGSNGLLAAMGYIWFNAATTLVEAALNLGLSVFFVLALDWGLAGVAAGTLVARLLTRSFIVPWYACRKVGIGWWNFVARIGGSGLAAGLLFTGWCLLVRTWFPADSWLAFFAQATIALAGYVPIAFLVLVPDQDRKQVLSKLRLIQTREP